jgi:hypothetical protein
MIVYVPGNLAVQDTAKKQKKYGVPKEAGGFTLTKDSLARRNWNGNNVCFLLYE